MAEMFIITFLYSSTFAYGIFEEILIAIFIGFIFSSAVLAMYMICLGTGLDAKLERWLDGE